MATTISTNGRKKLKTLQDDFNDKFPNLKIEFSSKPSIDDKGESIILRAKDKIDNSKTLSEVRTKTGDGKISINGRKKTETLEKEFQDVFGLFIQVSRWNRNSDGKEYWVQSSATDDWTLTFQNTFSKKDTKTKPKKDW
jgi:hypothetical protein